MNTLQQIEEDIKEFLNKELKEEGKTFLNEWDFQMSLSLFLTHIKDYKVHLEYSVPLGEKKCSSLIKAKLILIS